MTAHVVWNVASYWLALLYITWLLRILAWVSLLHMNRCAGLEGLIPSSMDSNITFKLLLLLFYVGFSASLDQVFGKMQKRSVVSCIAIQNMCIAECMIYMNCVHDMRISAYLRFYDTGISFFSF